MKNVLVGVLAVVAVLAVVGGYAFLMTPPWVKQDLKDWTAAKLGYQVVKKHDCDIIVMTKVYKKPTFSTWPPGIIFTVYEHLIVLQDGRARTFNSTFVYEVGGLHCNFWTEYVNN